MKLVLANNQTDRFVHFYDELRAASDGLFDYAPYEQLLFCFDSDADKPMTLYHLGTGKQLDDYDGIYLNGYLDTYELAAATATYCQTKQIAFVNQELANAPSLSKLTTYPKLVGNGIRVPRTVAGAKTALLSAAEHINTLTFPLVLKRADADRGIDNYKIYQADEIQSLLEQHDARSVWLLQEYVPNNGFYLVSFYDQQPVFSIFRSLEERPDGDARKAHMYKPAGGANAHLFEPSEIPAAVLQAAASSMDAMNRQIGSVDVLHDPETDQAYVLEVNYNPQLVTIETFKDVRIEAFLEGIKKIH